MSNAGVGTDLNIGFAIESTADTREAPDTFFEVRQESLMVKQGFIESEGLGSGVFATEKALAEKEVGGSMSMEFRNAAMADLCRWMFGGDPTPAGSDPYTRAFVEGAAFPTATIQAVKPYAGGLKPFDFIGAMCSTWTLSQAANQYALLQVQAFARDCLLNQSAATFAPPAAPDLFTAVNLTTTTPDGEVCFDAVNITGNNAVSRTYRSCADGNLAVLQAGGAGRPSVTGTLTSDFLDMDAHDRYLAGTEGELTIAYSLGAGKTFSIVANIYYTGESPTVGGPGIVKQGIPFRVIGIDALTATLVNAES